MTRMPKHASHHIGSARPNLLAILITGLAIGVLVLNFQLQPARAVSRVARRMPKISQLAPRPIIPAVSNAVTTNDSEQTELVKPIGSQQLFEGIVALKLHLALLEKGITWLEKQSDYTAFFHKQEYIEDDEEVTEVQTVEYKVRHEPFSVYMRWLDGDAGREVIYVDGMNDNKMAVHAGGGGLKSLLTLNLDPHGTIAMSESRYPITQSGILNMAKLLVDTRLRDLKQGDKVSCRMGSDQLFDERPCYSFVIEFGSEDVDPLYRKSHVLIDKEWSIPVHVRNYGWLDVEGDEELAQCTPEELDEYSFLESYGYTNIRFNQSMGDLDFDKSNEQYSFR